MSDIAIKVENLSKLYRLGEVGTGTISHDLNRWFARIRGKEDPFAKIGESNDRTKSSESNYVWALKDIDFEIKKGDAVGIIGRNGAGKSTLLKLLSKTTAPTTGQIKINGRIASLLEVGTGFHPEMTGRENIFLNGAILGMTKREIKSKFDEIVDFAGVARYVDTPVKRYSSGMYVRLAFAVAAHLEPEILIVDEVLAVGDAEFQKKCLGKMKDVSVNEGRTVLFVSHNMGAVAQLCNTGIVMQFGMTKFQGRVESAIEYYFQSNADNKSAVYVAKNTNKDLFLHTAYLLDETNTEQNEFKTDEVIRIAFNIGGTIKDKSKQRLFVSIMDNLSNPICSKETHIHQDKLVLEIDKNFLVRGSYSVNTIIYIPAAEQYDIQENICNFTIIDAGTEFAHLETFNYGTVFAKAQWI